MRPLTGSYPGRRVLSMVNYFNVFHAFALSVTFHTFPTDAPLIRTQGVPVRCERLQKSPQPSQKWVYACGQRSMQCVSCWKGMAGTTGLEPAISDVTGRTSKRPLCSPEVTHFRKRIGGGPRHPRRRRATVSARICGEAGRRLHSLVISLQKERAWPALIDV